MKSCYETDADITTDFSSLKCGKTFMNIKFSTNGKHKEVMHPVIIVPNDNKLNFEFKVYNVKNRNVEITYSITNNTGASISYGAFADITCKVDNSVVLIGGFTDFLKDLKNNESTLWTFTFTDPIDTTPFNGGKIYLESSIAYVLVH